MNEIYVTGHRNPDTDSIVAAIAYANLCNSLGDRSYKAARIGAVNDETQRLLDRFGFAPPDLLQDMRTQVQDLDFDRPPTLNASVTIDLAWQTMEKNSINTLPIVNEDGTLLGMLSAGDVASYDMRTISETRVEDIFLFNLLSVVEGTLVNELALEIHPVSGNVHIALPLSYEDPALEQPDTILICGDQPELVERAIQNKLSCVIICQSDVRPEWARCGTTCIISSPLSARRVSRVIYQAIPAERVCQKENIVSFRLTDYLDDVQEIMLENRFRAYPILDGQGKVVGTLSRFHLLRPRRKQVVLVDHNEAAQSVPGLEQVEVLEIIDHHRLGDIQTNQPVRVRNEPVGSTNTILAAMYQERGVIPSPKMAGLMAGAILSDTVLFKSPTCTERDIAMAQRLAWIAKVSLDDLGASLFSSNLDKSAWELFQSDYKNFHISGQSLAVSQITCDSADALLERKEEFLSCMEKVRQENNLGMVLLMLTDVLLEGTYLLYIGSDEAIHQAFSVEPKDGCVFLPGVMSRKKQIIPMLTALWG